VGSPAITLESSAIQRRVSGPARNTMPAQENGKHVPDRDRSDEFQRLAMPHLRSAYQLARWLTRSDHDAEDVMQESYLRAFKYFDGFHGTDARTWLLSIVRNTYCTWRDRQPARPEPGPVARAQVDVDADGLFFEMADDREPAPDAGLMREADQRTVDEAIGDLPLEFREVVVLREIEELSYKQIAAVLDVPIGTVMSRLARGREHLRRHFSVRVDEEAGT
jgi:RNA polymerase sigma-70 factor (ECF subfamily)